MILELLLRDTQVIITWYQVISTDDEYSLMRSNERGREVLQSVTARITVYERTSSGTLAHHHFYDFYITISMTFISPFL